MWNVEDVAIFRSTGFFRRACELSSAAVQDQCTLLHARARAQHGVSYRNSTIRGEICLATCSLQSFDLIVFCVLSAKSEAQTKKQMKQGFDQNHKLNGQQEFRCNQVASSCRTAPAQAELVKRSFSSADAPAPCGKPLLCDRFSRCKTDLRPVPIFSLEY